MKNNKQIIQPVTTSKKIVLEFYPATNTPKLDGTYFVLFQIVQPKKIEWQFGYADFNKGEWFVPDPMCIVNQWCILPSGKLLL